MYSGPVSVNVVAGAGTGVGAILVVDLRAHALTCSPCCGSKASEVVKSNLAQDKLLPFIISHASPCDSSL